MTLKILPLTAGLVLSSCASLGEAQGPPPATARQVTAAHEAGFSALSEQVEREMAEAKLRGLSIAVFDNYRLVYSHEWGVKSAASADPLDQQTAFSTASISKPVTALLCLQLAEKGLINLDDPIANYLTSWQIPENELTKDRPITWRDLLTHTAGTSQHGFADYYEGDKIPTLIDSLNGNIPRYDRPIEILFRPGSDWKYSGGGYVIIQLALEDHFGKPLGQMVQESIFSPIGMANTTMIQPGESGFPKNAASVHDKDGAIIGTGLPITPQISASGMWSTPTDLAKFSLAMQRALRGDEDGPISPAIARKMAQIFSLEYVGGMGTSWFRGFGFGNTDWLQHDGSNTGTGGEILVSAQGGYGMVVMANGDKPNRDPLMASMRREVIGIMGWGKSADSLPVPPELANALVGQYPSLLYNLGLDYEIVKNGDQLEIISPFFIQFLGRDRSTMRYLGGTRFKVTDYPNMLEFELDADGAVAAAVISREGSGAAPIRRDITAMREAKAQDD